MVGYHSGTQDQLQRQMRLCTRLGCSHPFFPNSPLLLSFQISILSRYYKCQVTTVPPTTRSQAGDVCSKRSRLVTGVAHDCQVRSSRVCRGRREASSVTRTASRLRSNHRTGDDRTLPFMDAGGSMSMWRATQGGTRRNLGRPESQYCRSASHLPQADRLSEKTELSAHAYVRCNRG